MIGPERVSQRTFREILEMSDDKSLARECFEFAEGCVRNYIFTRYPQRKGWALRKLRSALDQPELRIETASAGGVVYGYIGLEDGEYALVGIYRAKLNVLEAMPKRRQIK